jgi:Cu/Ag efflux protein CusF
MRVGKHFAAGLFIALVTVLTMVAFATAGEIEGKVQKVDMSAKAITLDDGTKLTVTDAAQLRDIKPGVNVKASFEERAGQKVATSISVEKGAAMPGAGRPAPAPRTQ